MPLYLATLEMLPPILFLSDLIVMSQEGENDGWISVKSAKRENFQETIPADHAQEIGHDLSFISRIGIFNRTAFDHLQFYDRIVEGLESSEND